MYINLNPDIMKSQSTQIDGYIEDFTTSRNDLRNTVSDIGNIWKDSSYDNFATKMEEFNQELMKLEESLSSFNNFIKGYVDVGSKLDSYYANKKIDIV